jgi:hypothetical protein
MLGYIAFLPEGACRMPMDLSVTANICPNCGKAATGNYCSHCGTKQGIEGRSDPHSPPAEAPAGNDRYRYYRTIFALIFSPVATVTKLTLDSNFKGYFSILFSVVAAKAAAFYVTFPTILRDVFARDANPSAKDAIEVTRYIFEQYISLALLSFVSYFLYRAVSRTARPPGQFVKFVAIAAIVFAIIDMASAAAMYASILALGPDITDNQFNTLYDGIDGLNRLVTLIFFAAVSCRFWQIGWFKALALGVPLAVLNWKVIDPYVQTLLVHATQ